MYRTDFKSQHILRDTSFKTVITTNSPIICFSDIHGDIDALIICLRDCGNVIKKKTDYVYDDKKRDPDLEKYLNLDLNDMKNEYVDDLNYTWSGGSTHVVIIGDILDPVRHNFNTEHVYPQVEIKILRFLNNLARAAMKSGGRIIKLCGNHELGNFISSGLEILDYMSESDKDNKNYYQGFKRLDYFKLGNPGFELFQEGGIGVAVLINNNFFVHGGLTSEYTIENFISMNDLINNDWTNEKLLYNEAKESTSVNNGATITLEEFSKKKEFIKKYEIKKKRLLNISSSNSPLWTREFNYNNKTIPIFIHKEKKVSSIFNYIASFFTKPKEDESDENILDSYFKILFKINDNKYYNIEDYRLIIGHSGQNASLLEYDNATFSHNESTTDKIIRYTNKEVYVGKGDFNNNLLFGISIACIEDLKEIKNPRLIRVDYNVSRGFDILPNALSKYCNNKEKLDNNLKNIIKILYESRTPQIFMIMKDNNLSIIKSKLKNTKINLPRQNFSGFDKDNKSKIYDIILKHSERIPSCNITKEMIDTMLNNEPSNSAYYDKYIKYKNKYFKALKKLD